MNIENALKIEGAMDPPELEWLAKQASNHIQIVEIGCWQGRSTRVLADNTHGKVWAVDTWKGSEEHQEFLKHKEKSWLFTRFCTNMADLNNWMDFSMTSLEAAKIFRNRHNFDMVFIDASHDYENVKADILAWRPLLRSGGLLCGHDAGYPPVAKAIQELIPNVQIAGCIWYTEV